MKKRMLLCGLVMVLVLCGCGKVKSAKALYKQAKYTHGACTMVSKSETDDRTQVMLHDTLQDFDYTMVSSMSQITIDGTNFGSVPGTKDGFTDGLKRKVVANVADGLAFACSMQGMYYEANGWDNAELILVVYAENVRDGETAAVQCAKLLQEQNQKHRLDNMLIYAVGNTEAEFYNNEHYVSVKLPDMVWRTPEMESADYYTEMAHMQTDGQANFLRIEHGTFADTGADLDRVVYVLGTDYPTEMNAPVTFYYFSSSKGQEDYLCDFNYYDEDHYHYAWYTNYRQEQ